MKSAFLLLSLLLFSSAVFAEKPEISDGWICLFNGRNLDGWTVHCQVQDANKIFWTVNNGAIECNSIGRPDHKYVWLMHESDFADFDLRLKFQVFKSSPGNSGVQFRSRYDNSGNAREGGWLNGPQVDIHPPTPFRTGLIYDETNEVFTKQAIETMQQWYNPETGLWRTTGWWNAANVLTGIIRYTAITGDKTNEWLIENTFDKTKKIVAPASEDYPEQRTENYINDYYDDEGWWALAWVEAYDLTGEKKYLEMAKTIFEDMKGGWDERCGGGILWKKGLLYKSAISNELFLLLAARLALRDENRSYYQEWAEKEWAWFSRTRMINHLPLVHDGVKEDCVGQGRHYTYNQGVILAGLVDLYQLNGNEEHLELANKIAMAAIQNMSTPEGILKGHPKEEGGADGVQFKGIFMRHLAYLYKHTQNPAFREYILENAKSIRNSATKTGLMGTQWYGPFDIAGAGQQSSAIDALVSALEAEN